MDSSSNRKKNFYLSPYSLRNHYLKFALDFFTKGFFRICNCYTRPLRLQYDPKNYCILQCFSWLRHFFRGKTLVIRKQVTSTDIFLKKPRGKSLIFFRTPSLKSQKNHAQKSQNHKKSHTESTKNHN